VVEVPTLALRFIPLQLHVIDGLCDLKRGSFSSAADSFLKVPATIDRFNDVRACVHTAFVFMCTCSICHVWSLNPYTWMQLVSVQDVALYGVLCALAGYHRNAVKSKLLDNETFRRVADTMPELAVLASNFIKCEFAECFRSLEQLKVGCSVHVRLAALAVVYQRDAMLILLVWHDEYRAVSRWICIWRATWASFSRKSERKPYDSF